MLSIHSIFFDTINSEMKPKKNSEWYIHTPITFIRKK